MPFEGKYLSICKNVLKIHTWSDSNAVPYLTMRLYTTNKKRKKVIDMPKKGIFGPGGPGSHGSGSHGSGSHGSCSHGSGSHGSGSHGSGLFDTCKTSNGTGSGSGSNHTHGPLDPGLPLELGLDPQKKNKKNKKNKKKNRKKNKNKKGK